MYKLIYNSSSVHDEGMKKVLAMCFSNIQERTGLMNVDGSGMVMSVSDLRVGCDDYCLPCCGILNYHEFGLDLDKICVNWCYFGRQTVV
jgi:hypothetical protein